MPEETKKVLQTGPIVQRTNGEKVRNKTFEQHKQILSRRTREYIPRQRAAAARKTYTRAQREQEIDPFVKKSIRNLVICAAVCLVVLALSVIPAPFAQQAMDGIRTALTFDVDVEETIGQLKFVQEQLPDVVNVFSASTSDDPKLQIIYPVDGSVVSRFVEQRNECIDIAAAQGTSVVAVAGGTVKSAGEDDYGKYVLVAHESGYSSMYRGLSEVAVSLGDAVNQGSVLGKVGTINDEPMLRLMVYKDEKAIDPLSLMGE